jgi:hypothetical protein
MKELVILGLSQEKRLSTWLLEWTRLFFTSEYLYKESVYIKAA